MLTVEMNSVKAEKDHLMDQVKQMKAKDRLLLSELVNSYLDEKGFAD